MVEVFNQILSILTLGLNVLFLVIILAIVFKRSTLDEKFFIFVKKYSYEFMFLLSVGGIVGSLIYSEIINFAPCNLCWWQRVFLYPIAFITTLALFKKDRTANDYLLTLSIPGALIALYHSALQISSNINPFLCTGLEEDCATVYFVNFGFVTLPFMAFSVFALIAIIAFISRNFENLK